MRIDVYPVEFCELVGIIGVRAFNALLHVKNIENTAIQDVLTIIKEETSITTLQLRTALKSLKKEKFIKAVRSPQNQKRVYYINKLKWKRMVADSTNYFYLFDSMIKYPFTVGMLLSYVVTHFNEHTEISLNDLFTDLDELKFSSILQAANVLKSGNEVLKQGQIYTCPTTTSVQQSCHTNISKIPIILKCTFSLNHTNRFIFLNIKFINKIYNNNFLSYKDTAIFSFEKKIVDVIVNETLKKSTKQPPKSIEKYTPKQNNFIFQKSLKQYDPTTPIVPELFPHFWNVYQNKKNKPTCQNLWNALCSNETMHDPPTWKVMKKAIQSYHHTLAWLEGYKLYPETFLRDARWEDEPEDERHLFIERCRDRYWKKGLYKDVGGDFIVGTLKRVGENLYEEELEAYVSNRGEDPPENYMFTLQKFITVYKKRLPDLVQLVTIKMFEKEYMNLYNWVTGKDYEM